MLLWLGCVACAQAGAPDNRYIDAAPHAIDGSMKLIDAHLVDAPSSVCPSALTCATAIDLGNVRGDTGADLKTASGYQAAWYKVRVTEDDSGPLGTKLQVSVTLASPASANYDLFVYLDTGSDVLECANPNGTATTSGTTQSRSIRWGEGTFSNGADDSRTASIEIRPSGTSCAASAPWSLTVKGD
ncbi:hypothetical protein BH11MYX1_BH11MYX1_02480 [soil metagenome]